MQAGSARDLIAKEDFNVPDNLVPVSTACGPMFDNLFRRQIQHLFEAVVVSKRGFVFGDFPELPVDALDDVGGIYDSPYLGWIESMKVFL